MTDRKSLLQAINRAEACLTELDNEKSKITKELHNLRDQLSRLSENHVIKEPTVL